MVSVCLLSLSPVMDELVGGAVAALGTAGNVVRVGSLSHASRWLEGHPRCRLVIIDADRGLWLVSPVEEFAPVLVSVTQLRTALRNLFHHWSELPSRRQESGLPGRLARG